MRQYNQLLTEQQISGLKELSNQTGLSASEWIRRMLDHCFQEKIINQLIPAMSGYVRTSK